MGRTSKNIKLRIPEKPHKIKGFRSESYRVATTISSQPRYDHFDTAAYLVVRTQIRITVSILLAFFRSAAHTRARKPLGDIAFWLLARPADVAISSQARCDHFDATLYSSVLRDGKRFYYGIFSGKFQGKPFNFSFVSLRPAFNHRAELWTCCPDRMGLRYLTGGIALRPTVFLWGLPGQYINYERALEIAGGRPLASPDLRDAVRCAALLLPGGGDMEPRRYGQANTASRGLEPERDTGELFLLEQFIMEKKPVLGICRGLQVLNVFFGGTLIQDLPGHSQAAGRDRLHRVRTAPSPLQDLFGETLVVNSAHHQAADRLGQGLRAVQWAIDGTVEAVIHQSLPVWGVQWHPERLAGPLSLSGAADGGCLFTAWLALAGGTGQS